MSVNRYKPHLYVFPEDDANRQLANGFVLAAATSQIQILPEAGGWVRVRDSFASDHVNGMNRYPHRHMILLIDFDNDESRLQNVKKAIPIDMTGRVFVLGTISHPEKLRNAGLGAYESIGKALAAECRDGVRTIWTHELLRHNADELDRLQASVCKSLFDQ